MARSRAPDAWNRNAAAVFRDVARRKRVAVAPALRPDHELVEAFVRAGRVTRCPARTFSGPLAQPERPKPVPAPKQPKAERPVKVARLRKGISA